MKRLFSMAILAVAVTATGCSKSNDALEIKPGTDVSLQRKDGVTVAGRLVEVKPEHVIVERTDGARTTVPRAEIAGLTAQDLKSGTPAGAPVTAAPPDAAVGSTGSTGTSDPQRAAERDRRSESAKPIERAPEYREVTVPAGTVLAVELTTAVASDTSRVEDAVRGTLRRTVTVDGVQALPAGSVVVGTVTAAERAARVKGRARVAFRFTTIDPPGGRERLAIRTDTVSRLAPATKKQDAAKIGGGAAGGAIIGGILGGGDGAAKGAAIGGAAGTGVVLSTRGKEVRLGPGAAVSVRLAAPVSVLVPTKRAS